MVGNRLAPSPRELYLNPVMNQFIVVAICVVSLCLTAMTGALAAAEVSQDPLPSTLVAPEVLESKIAEIEAVVDPQDEAGSMLLERYRGALTHLEETNANAERAGAFEAAIRTAPAETLQIREKIQAAQGTDPVDTLGVSLETPLEQVERQLTKEQVDLAAVDARRADFEKRLTYNQNRPAAISQRLAEAKQQQEEVVAALGLPPEAEEGPALSQAKRWELETRYAALSTEIKMLDQELISQSMRLDLLEAKRDQAVASIAWIGARTQVLSELVNRKRRREAEQATVDAEEAQRETAGLDPLLVHLAERNAALTDELNAMAGRLDTLDRQQAQAEQLAQRIAADYRDTETTLASGGMTSGLGRLLLKHRESLPDFKVYARKARARKQRIAELGGQRLLYREEARRIADPEQTVAALETEVSAAKTPRLRTQLRELVTQRQTLLEKTLESGEFYLRQLGELDTAEGQLIEATRTYDDFLREQLFWIRSTELVRLEDLVGLPDEAQRMLPAIRSDLNRAFQGQVMGFPGFWFALLAAAALIWKRRALIAAIEATSKPLGKPTADSFGYTLRALALTLVAAAPLPLVLAIMGWRLQFTDQGTDLSHEVGGSLLRVAEHLYFLGALRTMCIPQGLAAAHFHWPESNVRRLRAEFGWLIWFFVPAAFVTLFAVDLNPVEWGGVIARLGMVAFYAALALFLYRVFHPKRGVLAHLRSARGLLFRFSQLWFPLLLAFPLGLMALGLGGYIYTVATLSYPFTETLWLIAALVVLYALARRWLQVVGRRLAYEAAVERRRAALAARQAEASQAGGEEGGLQVEETEVDLAELSDESRQLIKIALIVTGLIVLYLTWSSLLPALRIFDDITLWTVAVEGQDERLAVTLGDVWLALIYAVGTAVLAKRLPAMLEIILLQRFHMSSGSRYTVTTLSAYGVVAIGILLVFNTLGTPWSQLQWLVAALGVGIGFGLQEIVANFISGLIILFERPIRIGDTVTVGDTDGVVTKIRIRATTIRNWDRKELLVPNKEFITGRLLNWSLSDQVTRIIVMVGVAYGTDVDKAFELMREAAEEHERVLDDPAPSVIFESFGDNSLGMLLRAFVDSVDLRYPTMSALNEAINEKFNAAGIVIAFPQRDLHLDTTRPLQVELRRGRDTPRDGASENDAAS